MWLKIQRVQIGVSRRAGSGWLTVPRMLRAPKRRPPEVFGGLPSTLHVGGGKVRRLLTYPSTPGMAQADAHGKPWEVRIFCESHSSRTVVAQ